MTPLNEKQAIPEKTMAGRWGLLALRLMVGFGFAAHGYAKLARGPEMFAALVQAMGLPAPDALAWATVLFELLGGIMLMAGAFVLPLSVPLAVVMLTAMFGVHFRFGFSSIKLKAITPDGAVFGPPGYELNLLYIAALIALALAPASPLSIDAWLAERRAHRARPL
jgi:putative oxidoreductase